MQYIIYQVRACQEPASGTLCLLQPPATLCLLATILHINLCQGGMFILPTGFQHSILDTYYTSSRHHPLKRWYLLQWITTYTLRDRICAIFSSPTLSIFDCFPTHYYYIGLWRTRPNCLTDSSAVGGKQRCGFTSKVSLMPVCVVHISSK